MARLLRRALRDGGAQHRYLTHIKRLKAPAEPLRRLLTPARHLGPALGPILFQLPASFRADLDRLDRFLAALARQRAAPHLRAALEVRHPSWLALEVTERLARAN